MYIFLNKSIFLFGKIFHICFNSFLLATFVKDIILIKSVHNILLVSTLKLRPLPKEMSTGHFSLLSKEKWNTVNKEGQVLNKSNHRAIFMVKPPLGERGI